MNITYTTTDKTTFDNCSDAFNYDWQDAYSNVRVFDDNGNMLAKIDEGDDVLIFKVNTRAEQNFVMDYLIAMYGEVDFWELWENLSGNEYPCYIVDDYDGITCMDAEGVLAYFSEAPLNPESALACELRIEEG